MTKKHVLVWTSPHLLLFGSSPRRGDRHRDKDKGRDRDKGKDKGKSANGVDLLSKLAAINARVAGKPAAVVSIFLLLFRSFEAGWGVKPDWGRVKSGHAKNIL